MFTQVSNFTNKHKNIYDTTVKRISKFLNGATDEGIQHELDLSKDLEAFLDANFSERVHECITKDPAHECFRTIFLTKKMVHQIN